MRAASFVIRLLGRGVVCRHAAGLAGLVCRAGEKGAAGRSGRARPGSGGPGKRGRRRQSRRARIAGGRKKSPEDAATHWQLGQVWIDSRWMTPDQAQKAASKDKRLAEYRKLRDRSVLTVDSQAALARWCRKNKLADEERAHWQTVLQLQPDNAEAIKALGLRPFAGTLLTQGQIQRVKSQLQTWAKAVDRWRPLVAQWRNAVKHHQTAPPAEVRDKLVKLSDSAEMLALERAVMAGGRRQTGERGVSCDAPSHDRNVGRQSAHRRRPKVPGPAGGLCDLKDVPTRRRRGVEKASVGSLRPAAAFRAANADRGPGGPTAGRPRRLPSRGEIRCSRRARWSINRPRQHFNCCFSLIGGSRGGLPHLAIGAGAAGVHDVCVSGADAIAASNRPAKLPIRRPSGRANKAIRTAKRQD